MSLTEQPDILGYPAAGGVPFRGTCILLVYIDNQSIGKDVWFDDLNVENYTSTVLEEDHYYPYGLTLNMTQMQTGANSQPYKLTTKHTYYATNAFSIHRSY